MDRIVYSYLAHWLNSDARPNANRRCNCCCCDGQCESGESTATTDISQEGVPAGFEAVSLIEALNGPTLPHCAPVVNADGTLRSLQFSDTSPPGV